MKARHGICIVLLLLTFRGPLAAEEKPGAADAQAYLEQLQARLEHTARRANQPAAGSSSVIGLRGSKQDPLSKQLYWKGRKEPESVNLEEVKAFRAAVELAREGKNNEALAALNTFQVKYLQSALGADVNETIRILSTTAPAPPLPDARAY